MANSAHNHDDLSELLSAYLDGEVTPAERALVERELAANAEFRQQYEELLGLRAHLKGLPRHRVPEDLAASVLRRAERAMISAPAATAGGGGTPVGNQVSLSTDAPSAWQTYRGHMGRWAVVATAVAIAVILFAPRNRGLENNIAKHTTQPADEATVESSANPPHNLSVENAPASALTEKSALRADAPAHNVAASRMAADQEATPAEAQLAGEATELNEEALQEESATEAAPMLAAPPKQQGAAPPAAAATIDAAEAKSKIEAPVATKALPLEMRARQFKATAEDHPLPAGRTAAADRAAAGDSARPAHEALQMAAPMEAATIASAPDRAAVLIVQCEVSQETLQSDVFRKLLAQQQFVVTELESEAADLADDRSADRAAPGHDPAAPQGDAAELATEALPQADAIEPPADADAPGAEDAAGSRDDAAGPPQSIDAFLVEASPEQLRQMLSALRARPDEFRQLEVQPMRDGVLPSAEATANKAQEESSPGRARRIVLDAASLKGLISTTDRRQPSFNQGQGGGGTGDTAPRDAARRAKSAKRSEAEGDAATEGAAAPLSAPDAGSQQPTRGFVRSVQPPPETPQADAPGAKAPALQAQVGKAETDKPRTFGDNSAGKDATAPQKVLFLFRAVPHEQPER